ncbi:MAG: GNAT family N-acetyltransferase [Acidimicrobiia bacterium]
MIEVRAVRDGEWQRLRAIRLEALSDTPEAFITTHAEAEAFPDDVWIDRVRKSSEAVEQTTIVAVDGADTVGLAVGLAPDAANDGVVPVVSVYVAPRARRVGVGKRLIQAVETWAASVGANSTSLWVVETNLAAIGFYESMGYRATRNRMPTPAPPPRWETRYEKQLTAGG